MNLKLVHNMKNLGKETPIECYIADKTTGERLGLVQYVSWEIDVKSQLPIVTLKLIGMDVEIINEIGTDIEIVNEA